MCLWSVQLQKILKAAKRLSVSSPSEHMKGRLTYPKFSLPTCSGPCNRSPAVQVLNHLVSRHAGCRVGNLPSHFLCPVPTYNPFPTPSSACTPPSSPSRPTIQTSLRTTIPGPSSPSHLPNHPQPCNPPPPSPPHPPRSPPLSEPSGKTPPSPTSSASSQPC